jgi:hypothetical protein
MKDRQMFRLGFFCRSAIASALLFFILSVFATANVLTWHNDDARTGRNLSEKILTPSNVNSAGAADALVDPTLELRDISGTLIASNDNWKSNQQAQIEATRLTPGDDRDAAIRPGITRRSCASPVGQRASHWWKLTRCIESNARRDPRSALSEVELGAPVQPANCVATRVALWPPKPNELFNTTRTFFSRATFGV